MKPYRFICSLGVAALLAGWGCGTHAAGLADHAIADGNVLVGFDTHNAPVWRYFSTGPLQVNPRPDGSFELNGRELVGRNGRLLAKRNDHAAAGPWLERPSAFATAAQTWSSPTELFNGSVYFAPPVFDSAGNAWAAVEDATTGGLTAVMKSDALTGAWTKVAELDSVFWDGSVAIDPQNDITMAAYAIYTDNGVSSFQLQAARYEPATGWSAVQVLYSTPDVINTNIGQNVYVVSDAQGDAIVVADLTAYGAAYWVYSAATKSWKGPTALSLPATSPSGPTVYSPNLARSPNGLNIQYTYADVPGAYQTTPALGYYTNTFNIASQTFGQPLLTPGTAGSDFYANPGSRVPAFVDDDGTISVIYNSYRFRQRRSTFGTRYSNKKWTSQKLLDNEISFFDVDTSQAMDAKGDFFLSFQGSLAAMSENVTVIKYIVGTGWSTDIAVTWVSSIGTSERAAWLGTSGDIVQVYMPIPEESGEYEALGSTIFDGTSWSAPTFVPPNNTLCFVEEMATDANGNVVLLYNPANTTTGAVLTNVFGTFMTP